MNYNIYRCLSANLEATTYAFKSGEISSISIEMNGTKQTSQLDPYFAFGIDDDQYITFVTDLDGAYWIDGTKSTAGIGIYPECGSESLATGNASILIKQINETSDGVRSAQQDVLAGGNVTNWYRLSNISNGDNQPIKFEFINDDIHNGFTFKFISATFPDGLNCTYNTSISIQKHFQMFMSPHTNNEQWLISSINITRCVTIYSRYILSALTMVECIAIIQVQQLRLDHNLYHLLSHQTMNLMLRSLNMMQLLH